MVLEGLSFVKALPTFRNIYPEDPLLQYMTKIVYSDGLPIIPLDHVE